MLHIATIHWESDEWVDIQLDYLRRHIHGPYQVYAWLNDLPDGHAAKYFYSTTEPVVAHAFKLNRLAEIASAEASSPDDLLMFIDGDAFPIGDVIAFGRRKLKRYPLLAVQRRENNGDLQPHPCFCLTTIGFWQSIGGDWREGHAWRNLQGVPTTDVGGNLLGILEQRLVEWYPMLRSNKHDLHPLFFALYEDLVYHHGAAFRTPVSRLDNVLAARRPLGAARFRLLEWLERQPAAPRLPWLMKLIDPRTRIGARNAHLKKRVYETIRADPQFYRYFQQEESGARPLPAARI
jgi:hypothetical protein